MPDPYTIMQFTARLFLFLDFSNIFSFGNPWFSFSPKLCIIPMLLYVFDGSFIPKQTVFPWVPNF